MKDARGGKEPAVGPMKSPWIEVPDDWLDDRYSNNDGYRALQEYFGLKIKPDIVNEYLIGKGIVPNVEIGVKRFVAEEKNGKLGIDATLNLYGVTKSGDCGTDTIEIYRTINWPENECSFDKIGASKINMGGFGVAYYRRVIPFLDKLGIKKITASPTTGPEESEERYRLVGAFIWSFYGYTNDNMPGTLNLYLEYLKTVKGLTLSRSEESALSLLPRMKDLARDVRRGEETGEMFLLGMDANNNPTRGVWWNGTHNDISNKSDSNIEMLELTQHLLHKMK